MDFINWGFCRIEVMEMQSTVLRLTNGEWLLLMTALSFQVYLTSLYFGV